MTVVTAQETPSRPLHLPFLRLVLQAPEKVHIHSCLRGDFFPPLESGCEDVSGSVQVPGDGSQEISFTDRGLLPQKLFNAGIQNQKVRFPGTAEPLPRNPTARTHGEAMP